MIASVRSSAARIATAIDRARAGRTASVAALSGLVLAFTVALSPSPARGAADSFGGPDPLPPTEAFVPAATLDGDTLRLDWTIADGYYLYRDKLSASLQGAATATLGPLEHSAALIVEDEFFGEQATFRDSAITRAPILDRPPGALEATVEVRFQGCADIGLCYPPTVTTLDVSLPAAPAQYDPPPASSALDAAGAGPAASLSSLFGNDASDELLPPDRAYRPELLGSAAGGATLGWRIEPGYYLYRDKLRVDLRTSAGRLIEDLPQSARSSASVQEDAFFGETSVWRDTASVQLDLGAAGPAPGEEATLVIHYQGCADIGVCFPPEITELAFIATDAPPATDASSAAFGATVADGPPPDAPGAPSARPVVDGTGAAAGAFGISEQDRLSAMLGSGSLWLSVATFFGLGLLLAFTPCVLPMVPILSSLIVGQRGADGAGVGGAQAFRLSAVYVLVMASTYAAAGVLVAMSGKNVQVWFQNPILLSVFAALFVVFALAMFGVFELQLPRALQARLTDASNAQRGRGYRGVIAMGFLSTLIVGPCVTAPLVGALVFIADTGNSVVGGAALFALGLGMGTPLLLVGTSAGSLLPRAGFWMVRVKQGFGILMLGMAVWMLSRFMGASSIALMTGLLALASGIWLGATDRIEPSSGGWPRLAKGAGLAVSLYGAAVLAGTFAGGADLLRPLAPFSGGGAGAAAGATAPHDRFERVANVEELDRVVAAAAAAGRPVMLDFYADWCISCKEMEAFTFTDPAVARLMDDMITVQVDVTRNDDADQALLKRFGLYAPPAIVFFDTDGRELREARVVGFMAAERFGDHLDRVLDVAVGRV